MYLIILSVACSVAVSIVLKLASQYPTLSLRQIIVYNYITAIILCYIILQPSLPKNNSLLHWHMLISLGILLPSIFIIMGYSIKHMGIIKTDIAQRLSLFIPVLASFTIFHESINLYKVISISCGFVAVILLFNRPQEITSTSVNKNKLLNLLYFFSVLVGFGVIDILFKHIAKSGTEFGVTLILTFSLSTIILLSIILIQRESININSILIGILLGSLNLANIYFYIRAHQFYANNPTLVFMSMNIGVIILSIFLGRIIFKELLTYQNWLGIILAILAIILLFNGNKLIFLA